MSSSSNKKKKTKASQTVTLSRVFDPSLSLITNSTPRRTYSRRQGDVRRASKWGQMKLLLGEVQWLTNHWDRIRDPEIILVVMGAAPGMHYAALAEMFDGIREIHLWDSSPFSTKLDTYNARIVLHRRRMYEKDAEEYASSRYPIFFASDIRSVGPDMKKDNGRGYSDREIEEGVWADHLLQQRTMTIIQPRSALLKFRLPFYMPNQSWQPLSRNYFAGHIYAQTFAPPSSTETRLVPREKSERTPDGKIQWETCEYSVQDYEEKLFYLNTVIRDDWNVRTRDGRLVRSLWLNSITKTTGVPDDGELVNNFDAVYAIDIINRYMYFIGDKETDPNVRLSKTMIIWNWARDSINERTKNIISLKERRENAGKYDNDNDDEEANMILTPETSQVLEPVINNDYQMVTTLAELPGLMTISEVEEYEL